jgi:SAM-dependent methyltransferase
MTADVQTWGQGIKVTPRTVLPHAFSGRTAADKLRSLAQVNPRLVPHMLATALRPRATGAVESFGRHIEARGLEFTYDGVSANIPSLAPLLQDFAGRSDEAIRYLEIGAYEGRNLAFLDWLLPGRLEVLAIDPWFDEALNPDENYRSIEARCRRNIARMGHKAVEIRRGFSSDELPKLRASNARFDLIYVDGSHAALDVLIDLSFAAALLVPGGMMILDDYWHDVAEIGGPGVKQAVDRFLAVFARYFRVAGAYRQVVLVKTDEIPR